MRFLILLLSLLFLAPPVANATVQTQQNITLLSAKSPKPAEVESKKKKKLGIVFAIFAGLGLGIGLSGTASVALILLGVLFDVVAIVFGILYLLAD